MRNQMCGHVISPYGGIRCHSSFPIPTIHRNRLIRPISHIWLHGGYNTITTLYRPLSIPIMVRIPRYIAFVHTAPFPAQIAISPFWYPNTVNADSFNGGRFWVISGHSVVGPGWRICARSGGQFGHFRPISAPSRPNCSELAQSISIPAQFHPVGFMPGIPSFPDMPAIIIPDIDIIIIPDIDNGIFAISAPPALGRRKRGRSSSAYEIPGAPIPSPMRALWRSRIGS